MKINNLPKRLLLTLWGIVLGASLLSAQNKTVKGVVLDKALERNGMEHTIYASDGGHVWFNWRLYLNTFARLLFK